MQRKKLVQIRERCQRRTLTSTMFPHTVRGEELGGNFRGQQLQNGQKLDLIVQLQPSDMLTEINDGRDARKVDSRLPSCTEVLRRKHETTLSYGSTSDETVVGSLLYPTYESYLRWESQTHYLASHKNPATTINASPHFAQLPHRNPFIMALHFCTPSKLSFSLTLLLPLLLSISAISSACVCPRRPFPELFSIFPTVVKAKTLSVVKISEIPTTYRFKLRVLNVFKGCRPETGIFYGESKLYGVVCQVFLRKGWIVRLVLRKPRGRLQGRPLYALGDCEEQLTWKATPIKEKRFLMMQRSLPENQCMT